MRPRQAAIDAEIALFDGNASSLFSAEEGAKEMEAELPGITNKLIEATRAVLLQHAPASEDRLRVKLAGILAQGLTPAQVRELTDFYNSSAGLSIIEQMYKINERVGSESFAEAVKSDKIDSKHFDRLRNEAAKNVTLTGRQEAALLEFMKTPTWQALAKLQPRLVRAQADFANAPDPAFEAAIEAATKKVLDQAAGAKG